MATYKVIIARRHDEDQRLVEADKMVIQDGQRLELYQGSSIKAVFMPGRWLDVEVVEPSFDDNGRIR